MTQTTELAALGFLNGAINKQTWGDFIVNVKVYGAKGDGVTDDTAAIQTAINYTISVGAKAVGFPHGTYKVTSLTGLSSVLLVGDNAVFSGISNTIIQLGSAVTQLSKLTDVDMTLPPTNGQVLSYNSSSAKWNPTNPTSTTVTNVKDYGALGDGVTDDTAAIQAAVNAIPDAQAYLMDPGKAGGILFFPIGNYRISGTILIDRPGVRVTGVSVEASVISPLASFVGNAAIKFINGVFAIIGIGMNNIRVDMGGYGQHGILVNKAYDNVSFVDVDVKNISDTGNGFRFEPQAGYTPDPISQTVILMNCMAIHKNNTATAPLFYFDSCQEFNLIGCKAFGTWEANLNPPSYTLAPLLNPYYFKDCRGITMLGCSTAMTNSHGIKIESVNRVSEGFLIDGVTFETCIGGALKCIGTATNAVTHVYLKNSRFAGSVGPVDLDYTNFGTFETIGSTVNIAATCIQVHIHTNLISSVNDLGVDTSIIGYANAINHSYVIGPTLDILAPTNPNIEFKSRIDANVYSVQYDKTSGADTGLHIRKNAADIASFTDANVYLYSNGALNITVSHPFSANQTGIILTVNNGTAVQKRVEIGAADSGGVGFRMLRVSN